MANQVIYLSHHPPSSVHPTRRQMFPASPLQILGARRSSVSFVPKFPREELAGLDNASSFLLSFLISAVRTVKKKKRAPGCGRQIGASENVPPLLDGNCMRLVCVSVWFTCVSLIMTACGTVWFLGYFDSLQPGQKALQSLKLDQSRQGLKSRRPAGRRSEETQTLARAIVRYTVAAGAHNFSLCMFFILLSSPSLIFGSEWWMTQLKVCEVFIWFWRKETPRICSLFQLSLWDLKLVGVRAHTHIFTRVHVWTLLSKPNTTRKLWSN